MSSLIRRFLVLTAVSTLLLSAAMADSISPKRAISIAVNDFAVLPDEIVLRHPHHTARWNRDGLVFTPRSGPVWQWKLTSVCAAERAVDFDQGVSPTAAAELLRVDFNRGSLIERYIAGPAAIEQQFVLNRPLSAGSGDLVIEGTVAAAAEWSAAKRGWVWGNARGVVSLGNVTVFDAEGAILPARMEVSSDRTRIIVDGGALSNASYPVTIDPEIGTNDFRISDMGTDGSTVEAAYYPAVAYNSTNHQFLVVWQGFEGNQNEIYGQRIDAATGAELGTNDFRISDMGDETFTFSANGPAVAWNSTNNEYLVVWRGDDNVGGLVDNEAEIFGQRINAATGAEVGTNDFRISNMGVNGLAAVDGGGEADWPSVAYNSTNNEYLVVWHGTHARSERVTEIFGQRINAAAGAEVGTNDFIITDFNPAPSTFRNALEPKVAYNSGNNEYLVVWYGENLNDNEVDIFGQRINAATGAEAGTNDFQISDMGPAGNTNYRGDWPDVVYNPTRNEYLVAWAGSDDTLTAMGEKEIFAQRINGATGAEVGTNDYRISDMGPDGNILFEPSYPEVTYSAIAREYLVVWTGADVTAFATEVHGQRLNMFGEEIGDNDFRLSDMGASDTDINYQTGDPAVAYGSHGIALAVWRADDNTPPLVNDELEIFGQLFFVTPPIEFHGDFNGDGRDDILLRDTLGSFGIWLMNGPAITGGGLVGSAGGYTVGGIGDFDGDLKDDILLRDSLGNLGMWIMNGATISSGYFVGAPGAYTVAAVADFNGDGKADILLRDSLGNLGMWIMNGPNIVSGHFVGTPGNYSVAAARDFNGDGKADILLRDTGGNLGMWIMNGPNIVSGHFVGAPGAYDVVGVNDFNADAKADILLRDSLGNLGMWIMNASVITSGSFVGSPGAYQVNSVGDYNGDNRADILLRHPPTGDMGLWIMNGGAIISGHLAGSPGTAYEVF